MKKEIADKWVTALRSEKYKQGRGKLRKNAPLGTASFCCLGVLCNLHAMEHPNIAAKQRNPDEYLNEDSFLPEKVMSWSGMKSRDGSYLNYQEELTSKNDNGASFKQIANIIEKHWKEL